MSSWGSQNVHLRLLSLAEQLGSGEQCCNKYWPDDEEMYEHISVKLVSSESYPKYSCRSFLLTNTKVSRTGCNLTCIGGKESGKFPFVRIQTLISCIPVKSS